MTTTISTTTKLFNIFLWTKEKQRKRSTFLRSQMCRDPTRGPISTVPYCESIALMNSDILQGHKFGEFISREGMKLRFVFSPKAPESITTNLWFR
ncbi:hypothetical protein Leryth_018594, partial [Lithospermum erythrorhizon]